MACVNENSLADNFNKPFPKRLRELLKDTKTSQSKLAEALHITRQAVNAYTLGTSVPDIEKFERIADYFNVSFDFLLGRSDCKKSENNNIHEETGLSEKAIETLKDLIECDKRNSVTLTINTLIEDKKTLYSIAQYLYYVMDESANKRHTGLPHVVPFYEKYKYRKIGTFSSPKKAPIDCDVSLEALTPDNYKNIRLLDIQDGLRALLEQENKTTHFKEAK